MRILVTGGSGFIGTNLVEHFTKSADEVLNLDIQPPRNPEHHQYWRACDILDGDTLLSHVHEFSPEFIFHMAARTDLNGQTVDDYAANTVGVENLIHAVESLPSLRRIIFASSRLVCRIGYMPHDELDYCPSTPYGESKVIGEEIVRAAASRISCSWIIVRPTSIWGPWFDVPYKDFFLSIATGRYVHPGNVMIEKSFGFVGNTVDELVHLMNAPSDRVSGKTLYLADYPPINVKIFADAIQRTMCARPIRTVDICFIHAIAKIGDALKRLGWQNPPLTTFRLNNLLTPMVHDLEPLQAIVGPLPYSMDDGVRITVDWLKGQGEIR